MILDNNKIAFIIAVNNEIFFEECKYYIHQLNINADYTIEIIPLRGFTGMTAAYNSALKKSDAKYKIYLHQDVFIINKNLINEILQLFKSRPDVGLIGVIGAKNIPIDGTLFNSWTYGNVISSCVYGSITYKLDTNEAYVSAIDGMFMATQYDIPWREDIIKSWHFYDISQSFEFLKHGYKLMVLEQNEVSCIHDIELLNLIEYDAEKENFWNHYSNMFLSDWEFTNTISENGKKKYHLTNELLPSLILLLEHKQWTEFKTAINCFDEFETLNAEYVKLSHFLEIKNLEEKYLLNSDDSFFFQFDTYHELIERFNKTRFLIYRLQYNYNSTSLTDLNSYIKNNNISNACVFIILKYNISKKEDVITILTKNNIWNDNFWERLHLWI